MTIKSQGGIFGRNPTFNDVEVDGTLTVGGNAVPDASTLLVDGDIGSTVQAYDADTAKLDANQTFTGSNNFTQNVYIQNSSFPTFSLYNAGGERVKLYYDTNTGFAVLGTTVAAPVKFYVNNGEVASFTTSGNLAFPSGNGIDFSATAGTGTSELFSDYEEGTWSPVDGSGAGLSFSSVSGYYTKVGRIVTATFALVFPSTADGSAARIGGIPFASAAFGNGQNSGSFTVNNSGQSIQPSIVSGDTKIAAIIYTTGISATNANLSGATLSGGIVYYS